MRLRVTNRFFASHSPLPSFTVLLSSPASSSSSSSKPLFFPISKPLSFSNYSNSPTTDHLKSPSLDWLSNWPPPNAVVESDAKSVNPKLEKCSDHAKSRSGTSAIERIVLRLRNLGLGSDDDTEEDEEDGSLETAAICEEGFDDLLSRDWVRPDTMLIGELDGAVLPRERVTDEGGRRGEKKVKKRIANAPTLAELTLDVKELRRLRALGMMMRERVTVPKAGVTWSVVEKIHDRWRQSELVRLKFHENLAREMKTAHEIVERRTGGLVIWSSGSVMFVFRGANYTAPSKPGTVERDADSDLVPDISSVSNSIARNVDGESLSVILRSPVMPDHIETAKEEESNFEDLLEGLGPRFDDWWGIGLVPVDADLLPQTIPGYNPPLRLLPTGMRSKLTDAELTSLRKLAKSLPCHFALGRNRNHQGLASSIIKLWEKSLIVNIPVKRGVQNTNNKLMAEELKKDSNWVDRRKMLRIKLKEQHEKRIHWLNKDHCLPLPR